MIDDRGYIGQALVDRLHDEDLPFAVLGEGEDLSGSALEELQVAVPHRALGDMPRVVARFAHDFDLQLVRLERSAPRAWRFVLAWTNEVGRPRFVSARVLAGYYWGPRLLLRAEELLAAGPDVRFIHGLLDGLERGTLPGAWLSRMWREDPHGALGQAARFWPAPSRLRLLSQAAKRDEWAPVQAAAPALASGLRRAVLPRPAGLAEALGVLALRLARPGGARIALGGGGAGLRALVLAQVTRDLAPLGLAVGEDAPGARADLRVSLDGHANPAVAALEAEREILRWLQLRAERRHPEALVGRNPPAARFLQAAARAGAAWAGLPLGCHIGCRLRSPVLMPYPFGIVIEAGAVLGSRVTVMQQATIGRRSRADPGTPVIEDNVCIGPGARVLGAVRIGRGATVGANAVVTRDVPSHCTVVGANRILGRDAPDVVERRRGEERIVVNT